MRRAGNCFTCGWGCRKAARCIGFFHWKHDAPQDANLGGTDAPAWRQPMLILTRTIGQSLKLGDNIEVKLLRIDAQ